MPTRKEFDHIGSTQFKIEIEGVTQGSFAAVDGMEATIEVITFVDGDGMLVRKRPGRTNYANIVFRRGFVNNPELYDWYKAASEGKAERKAGSTIVWDETANEICRYNFFKGWPCRWKSLVMQADVPGALVEELEIVIEKIERG